MTNGLKRLIELNDELFADGNAFHDAGEITYLSGVHEIKQQLINEFKTIVSVLPICIHEINTSGQITMMNPAGLEMLNLTDESQIIGKNYLRYVADCDRDRIDQLLENATQGASSTFTFKSPSGQYFTSCFIPVLKGSNVEKIIGYSNDITEFKK
jgi:PAS domain S-box-containing protein